MILLKALVRIANGLVCMLIACTGFAQPSPQWGNLKPGAYSVGYTTIHTVDYSKTYFEAGRPLQIYVWYPASTQTKTGYLKFGAYLDDASYDWGHDPKQVTYLKQYVRKGFISGALNPSFPGELSESAFKAILNTPIPVIRNAIAAKGKFPVLLHSHVSGVLHQSLLMEFLASHGYVVMSVSRYNTSPAFYGRGEDGIPALLQLTEDMAFVLAQARKIPYADADNAAMIGMTAEAGLSLQFKEMLLKAIACLDCLWIWDAQSIQQLPYFDPRKIRIPLLEIANTQMHQQQAILDSLPFADRYIGKFNTFAHSDFYPFPNIANPSQSANYIRHEYLLKSTLHFLNATLKDDKPGKAFLENPTQTGEIPNGILTIQTKPAKPAIPTESELLTWLRYGQIEKVKQAWNTAKHPLVSQSNFFFATLMLISDNEPQAAEAIKLYLSAYPPENERTFNLFGYSLLHVRKASKALKMFEQSVKQFPTSPYGYEGLAQVYLSIGNKEKAAELAKKGLEIVEASPLSAQEKESLRKSFQKNTGQ